MKSVCAVSLLVISAFAVLELHAGSVLSLEEAVKKGFIKVTIKSKGGYTGEVIAVRAVNTSGADLEIFIEVGRRLDSRTENEQDILVTKPMEIFVRAGQQRSFNVWGMCCQAHNACPHKDGIYSAGHMADSNLIRFAHFVHDNAYYSEYAAQQGVWAISDNNSIGSIEDADSTVESKIRSFVSHLTGRPIPTYKVRYGNGTFTDVLGNATRIEGAIEYVLAESGHVTVAIYNRSGKLIQMVIDDMASASGIYKIYYTFRTRELPAGVYYVRMTDAAGIVRKEEEVSF